MNNLFKKILINILLGVIVFSFTAPVLFLPKPAYGQAVVIIGEDIPEVRKTILDKIKEALMQASAVAWKNSLSMFLGKFAQESATWLATGGKSGGVAFLNDSDYWNKMKDSVIGETIDTIAREGFGVASLCDPIDPLLKFNILVSGLGGVSTSAFDPEVRCSLTQRFNRLLEWSATNMIAIDLDFKEKGRSAQSLENIFLADAKVLPGAKTELRNLTKKIFEMSNKISALAERLREYTDKFKDRSQGNAAEWNTAKEQFASEIEKLEIELSSEIEKKIVELKGYEVCLKNKIQEFCVENKGAIINCSTGFICEQDLGNCIKEGNVEACREKIRTFLNYLKQIDDLSNYLRKAIEDFKTTVETLEAPDVDYLKDLQRKTNPGGSDLDLASSVKIGAESKAAQEIVDSKFMQSLGGTIKGVASKISGIIMTPPELAKDFLTQKLVSDPSKYPWAYTGYAIADAINVFTTTFLGTLQKTILEKGIVSPQLTGIGLNFGFNNQQSAYTNGIYAELANVSLIRAETDFDILNQYSSCPDKRYALPTQCVIDASFARAVENNLTIEEAITRNYIKGDWSIGADGENDLMKIKKLRRARIIPLGLEIAAEKIIKGEAEKATLKEIVDGFSEIDSEGFCDEVKGAGPFCHLVNPKWVLKAPKVICDISGPTAIPLSGSPERQESCINWKDCVGEDEEGNCHTWGYCTREKNTWRFSGTECPDYYNSCQNYTRKSDNKIFSLTSKTIDFSGCNVNSIGCQWYCQRWESSLSFDGDWACQEPGVSIRKSGDEIETYSDLDNTIFLNRLVKSCESSSEGCTKFIRTKEGLGTNLLPNSSFEETVQENYMLKALGWWFSKNETGMGNGDFIDDRTKSYNGNVYAIFNETGYLSPLNINSEFLPDKKYNFSFVVKNISTDSDRTITFKIENTEIAKTWVIEKNSSWLLLSYTFSTPSVFDKKFLSLRIFSNGGDILLDDLQMLFGDFSYYKNYASNNLVNLKKAPDNLLCYNRDELGFLKTGDNSPTCSNFLKACNQDEVGCNYYQPVNNDPAIPAIVKGDDFCLEECVGYNSYREKQTNFYPQREISFIPRSARTCPVSEVGCEGFTNIDEVNRGGEGRVFYSSLRACQRPDQSCANFYTWIGSENKGYEIKKYLLRKDEISGAPFGMLLPSQAEELWGKCQDAEDARINSYCKEFYNENGSVSYHLYPNSVVCRDECLNLRKNKPIPSSFCWPALFQGEEPLNNMPLIDGLSFKTEGGETCSVPWGGKTCLTPSGEVCELADGCGSGGPGGCHHRQIWFINNINNIFSSSF